MQQFGHGVRESRVCFGTPRFGIGNFIFGVLNLVIGILLLSSPIAATLAKAGNAYYGNAPVWDALYQRPNADIRQRRVSLEMGVAPHAMSLSMALRANFLQDSTRP